MENVLDLLAKPVNEREPVVALDERPVQLLDSARPGTPMAPGRLARRDYEYVRHGTANVFCIVAPKVGGHLTHATRNRKAPRFADAMKRIAAAFPSAKTIHVVMDNLNTHCEKSLIDAFGALEGRRLWRRFTVHYTPKHASWLNPAEIEVLKKGLAASLAGETPPYTMQQYGEKLRARADARSATAAAPEKQRSAAFRESAAAEAGALRLPSGLVYKTVRPGKGPSPGPTDVVRVHYHGTLQDGKVFDSSVQRGQPVEFPLNQVIPCWTEGVQRMKVGEKAKLVCPSEIAYGDRGTPDGSIPPGSTIVFEVELLGIKGR